MSTAALRALAAATVVAVAGSAHAQRTAFDLERLSLDPSAVGSLVLGSGDTLPAAGFRLSLAGHYERQPLVLAPDRDLRGRGLFDERTRDRDVVTDRFTAHLGLAVGLADWLELGVRVPYVVDQSGDDLSSAGFPPLRSSTIGTPSAMLRFGVLSQRRGAPVSLAIAVEAAVPFERSSDLTGEPEEVYTPRLELGHSYGGALVAANVGANLRRSELELPNGERLSHELLAGLVVATTGRPLRFEASARGAFNFDGLSQNVELLAGLRYAFGRWGELFVLGGPGFLESPGTPRFRGLVGLALGRTEAAEAAPAAAPPPAPPPEADPCAPGQPHRPEQCPDLDDDGDGIRNADDRCPLEKGIAATRGCPPVDSDGDGVADHEDRCPREKGDPRDQGCPPADRDRDGVPDADDRCPDQPGIPEEQGCPPQRAEIKVDEKTGEAKIDIKEKVFFQTNRSEIQPRSFPLLDDVAKLIVANPAAGTISIEGHTDDRGSAELNRALSLARAEAVKAYLVQKGVDAARLEAQGFGPDRPAEPNTTARGREANRRVEFVIRGVR